DGECKGFSKAMRVVDEWVVGRVLEFASRPDMMKLTQEAALREALADRDRLQRDVEHLRARLGELDGRFERWAEALTAGAMTIEQFRKQNQKLLREKEELGAALAEAEERLKAQSEHERVLREVQEALKDLPRVWAHLEPDERKEVLRLVVEELALCKSNGAVVARLRLRYGPEYEEVL
ncbi:MAG: hypothetical protein N3A38_17070, partial [Planctomycetota bacterium]|nr:hypothetical protein [Planctomycetota bacterium]